MNFYKPFTGQIVVLMTPIGEIVGRFKTGSENWVELKDPRLFFASGEGQGGFTPGVSQIGVSEPDSSPFSTSQIITIQIARDEVAQAWQQVTTGLVVPQGAL